MDSTQMCLSKDIIHRSLELLTQLDTMFLLHTSLVPRPHPVMRKNGLLNQVQFLGLVFTLVTDSVTQHYSKCFVPNPHT